MKIALRTLSVALTLSFCAVAFQFGAIFPFGEGYNPAVPDIDTHYSENYDEALFQQIQVGDSISRVISLIGEPFSISDHYDDGLHYHYSDDGACSWNDFAWLQKDLVVNEAGLVIKIIDRIVYD